MKCSSVEYDPNVAKTTFTFAHGPGRLTVAPDESNSRPTDVSSIGFMPHKRQKQSDVYDHVPLDDMPVVIGGKLVARARQFVDVNTSNWTQCFQPGTIEAMRAQSSPHNNSLTFYFNPPLAAKESEDPDTSADVVAEVVQPEEEVGSLGDAPSPDDECVQCPMSPLPSPPPPPSPQWSQWSLGEGEINEESQLCPMVCQSCHGDGLVWYEKQRYMEWCNACAGGGFA